MKPKGADRVVLHPDDVQVLYTQDGELAGYIIERRLLQASHPEPDSLPKLPQSIFNLENRETI